MYIFKYALYVYAVRTLDKPFQMFYTSETSNTIYILFFYPIPKIAGTTIKYNFIFYILLFIIFIIILILLSKMSIKPNNSS